MLAFTQIKNMQNVTLYYLLTPEYVKNNKEKKGNNEQTYLWGKG